MQGKNKIPTVLSKDEIDEFFSNISGAYEVKARAKFNRTIMNAVISYIARL